MTEFFHLMPKSKEAAWIVVRAPALQSESLLGFKSNPDYQLDLFLGSPELSLYFAFRI